MVQIFNRYLKQGFLIKVIHIYIFNYNGRPKVRSNKNCLFELYL